jgi:class 3 adenylate cyclase
MTVHESARMLALAAPGQVLVSAVTRQLAGEASLRYVDVGEFQLKGIGGPRQLFAVTLVS